MNPLYVNCPACGAYANEPCQSLSTLPGALARLKDCHAERKARAKEQTFPDFVRSVTFPRHVRTNGEAVWETGKSPLELAEAAAAERQLKEPLAVLCPACGARPAEECHNLAGLGKHTGTHPARILALRQTAKEQRTALVWEMDGLRTDIQHEREKTADLRAALSAEVKRREEAEAALRRTTLKVTPPTRAEILEAEAEYKAKFERLKAFGPCPVCGEGIVGPGKPCKACGHAL